jgi:toxin ParE1/3/4
MGCKVILTPQSLNDLESIVTFIARDNPGRARTFGNELIDRALATAAFPELGRVVPEIGKPAVREIIHGARGEPEIKPAV